MALLAWGRVYHCCLVSAAGHSLAAVLLPPPPLRLLSTLLFSSPSRFFLCLLRLQLLGRVQQHQEQPGAPPTRTHLHLGAALCRFLSRFRGPFPPTLGYRQTNFLKQLDRQSPPPKLTHPRPFLSRPASSSFTPPLAAACVPQLGNLLGAGGVLCFLNVQVVKPPPPRQNKTSMLLAALAPLSWCRSLLF